MNRGQCNDLYGLDHFIERYGHRPGFPDMWQHVAEFDDWQLIVPYQPRPLTILCCPEDRKCEGQDARRCLSGKTLCGECAVRAVADREQSSRDARSGSGE